MNIRKPVDYSEMFSSLDTIMAAQLPQMKLYCEIGRLVNARVEKGAAVAAAEYLQKTYPENSGFSPRNLRRMREFYRTYKEAPNLMSKAMKLGWTQNVVIMEADLTEIERAWYIQAAQRFSWPKLELADKIRERVHEYLILDTVDGSCYTIKNNTAQGNIISTDRKEDYMDIEKIATNCVENVISKSDYLVSHINSGDKEPSWDGDVEVYTAPGDTHKKETLYLKVPVQVKGFKSCNIKKPEITYPIEISDLRNYLQVGGTMYFVVYADPSSDNRRIYYARLLPFELKQILEQYGNQRSRRIKLRPFPTDKDEIADVFLSFARDMKKQRAAIAAQPVSWESLAKEGQLKELTFGYKGIPRKNKLAFDFMFDHGAYLYAKLPFGIELPIQHIEHVDLVKTTNNAIVRVGGEVFYNRYDVVYQKDVIELHFGKSTCCTIIRNDPNKQRFTFKLSGTLKERIRDEHFIIEAIKTGHFEVNGSPCSLAEITSEERATLDIPRREEHLAWLRSVKETLDRLHVKDDLDISCLTEIDEFNLSLLKTAVIDGKPIRIKDTGSLFGVFKVGNLRILVMAQKSKDNPKLFDFCSYNDAKLEVKAPTDEGQDVPSSYHVLLKKDAMLECCNIDYHMILEDLKRVPFSERYSEQVVLLLLEMLDAYDHSNPQDETLIAAATDLATYLRDNDPYTPRCILDLNYYQTLRRQRPLTEEERCELIKLVESPTEQEDVYVGAYLLLGNQAAAEMHFSKLEPTHREIIQKYPIYHFWKPELVKRGESSD